MPSNQRLTTEQFIAKAREIHGHHYDYSKVRYVNNRTKVEIICPRHGVFSQIPQNHLKNGHGCAKCGKERAAQRSAQEFQAFKLEFQDLYPEHELPESKIFSPGIKTPVVCAHHGVFSASPEALRASWCCPKCKPRRIPEKYAKRLRIAYPHFDYSESEFVSRDHPIIVRCRDHGPFEVHFRRHLKGQIGCSGCKDQKVRPQVTPIARKDLEDQNRRSQFQELFGQELQYIGYHEGYVIYRCPIHGTKKARWVNVRKGKGCRECAIQKFRDSQNLDRQHIIQEFQAIHQGKYDYRDLQYLNYRTPLDIICPEHGKFQQYYRVHLAGGGCPLCNVSSQHTKIARILDQIEIQYFSNRRDIISPYELDIWIPDHKLAIEINGAYWHSHDKIHEIEPKRHQNKLKLCLKQGITLLQFLDQEIDQKSELVSSMILNRLGLSSRIYARKTKVSEIPNSVGREFLAVNHLKGSGSAKLYLGLEYDQELVSVMSFNPGWKIDRLATKIGHTVVGGPQKLFRHFLKLVNPESVVTYADARYSTGNVYERLGFARNPTLTQPGYQYFRNGRLYSRQKFQKHKLSDLYQKGILQHFNPIWSEREIMLRNGYRILFDSGNWKFEAQYFRV